MGGLRQLAERTSHLRQLAERTPANRERYIDLLRVVAISMVVLGHWTIAVIDYDRAGNPTGRSALADLPWAYPLTWLAQVMPVFFLVGGYANAASLAARRRRGGDATGWLLDRATRLVRPTTALLLVLAASAAVAWLRGVDATQIRVVIWFATIPLWFLAAYLVVVPLTPLMYALHRRFGLLVPVVLVALVGAGDLARLAGYSVLANGSYLFGWVAIHQLGFAWYDARQPDTDVTAQRSGLRSRRLPLGRSAGVLLLFGGVGALLLLTVVGPYPVNLLSVPGQRWDNASPPSLALLAAAASQLGLILLLRNPAERWLRRCRPWEVVIAVNSVVLTVFLWHLTAAVLLIGALDALHWLPTPPVPSAAWFAWRVPWLLMLILVLTVLVAIFGPIEARAARQARSSRNQRAEQQASAERHMGVRQPTSTQRSWLLGCLALAGFVAVVLGLLLNSLTPKYAAEPLGVPATALITYLVGAGTLRLLKFYEDQMVRSRGI